MSKKLFIRDEETHEELELGQLTGFTCEAHTPSQVKVSLSTPLRYQVFVELVELFEPDYHPGLSDKDKHEPLCGIHTALPRCTCGVEGDTK